MSVACLRLPMLAVASCVRYVDVNDADLHCYKVRNEQPANADCTAVGKRLGFNSSQAPDFARWWVRNVVGGFENLFVNDSTVNPDVSNWDTSQATTFAGMFDGAAAFNHPIDKWSVGSVGHNGGSFKRFLSGATAFNQTIHLRAKSCNSFASLLEGATSMNRPVTVLGSKDAVFDNLLANATSFNQRLVIESLDTALSLNGMLKGATAFNQPLYWQNLNPVAQVADVFAGASSMQYSAASWPVTYVAPSPRCNRVLPGVQTCYRCTLPPGPESGSLVPKGLAAAFVLTLSALVTVAAVDRIVTSQPVP